MEGLKGWYGPLIVGSDTPAKIGERCVGIKSAHGEVNDQPYVVLRKATVEEFVALATPRIGAPTKKQLRAMANAYFYEVSVD